MNLSNIQDKDFEAEHQYHDHTQWLDHLPRDLSIEILSRLPSKDLCKSRCVSRSWRVLLTRDREFMARHIQLSKRNPLSLVRRYISHGIAAEIYNGRSKITVELTSADMRGNITDCFKETIDGPVNTFVSCGPLSIMCCASSLYVCNPSTRQLVRVPRRDSARLQNVGFGYLPTTNEYKIAHMFRRSAASLDMGCEIFSFEGGGGSVASSGSWRAIGDCPLIPWTDEYPVCVSGTIYWAVSSGVWKDKSILCLDLGKEEFRGICYPMDENKKYTSLEYAGLMGNLCVVGFLSTSMDIWRMKDKDKGVWGVEYSVDLFPLYPKFLIPCDDGSDEIFVHMEQLELICYSVRSGTLRKVEYYKAMKTYNKPCLYYGSLIPL